MTGDFYCDAVLVHVVVIPKRHVPSLIYLGGGEETRRAVGRETGYVRDHGVGTAEPYSIARVADS